MQRLALFDLGRTLIDLDDAITRWAEEFAEQHHLKPEDVAWLVSLDQGLHPHREVFFNEVREHFALAASVEEPWAGYRQRMPQLVQCYPGVLSELADQRRRVARVGIVTNGMADNQLGKLRRTGLADVVDGYAVSGLRVSGSRMLASSTSPPSDAEPASSRAVGWWVTTSSRTSQVLMLRVCAASRSIEVFRRGTGIGPITWWRV